MLALISPAKKLLTQYNPYLKATSEPVLKKEALQLAKLMKTKTTADLAALMDLSADLAKLNYDRYQEFMLRKQDPPQSYPAIYLFQGDVYQGLKAASWDQLTLDFAQSHLCILSGLYGLLHPLDRIQPYRLEMGVHLENPKGKNLYEYWKKSLTKQLKLLLSAQETPVLINLASTEYFKVVDTKQLGFPVMTINFYEQQNNQLKIIGIHAKKARGTMAKFIMEHQIDDLSGLKKFNELGYQWSKESSTDEHFDFIRV